MAVITDPPDSCPPVVLPPDTVFPTRVDVQVRSLVLRDKDDLDDLNNLLAQIRRIPHRPPNQYITDPAELAPIRSLAWIDQQREAGKLTQYEGMFIAVIGEDVIDADRDPEELGRRVEARGYTFPQSRMVVRYIPGPDEPFVY